MRRLSIGSTPRRSRKQSEGNLGFGAEEGLADDRPALIGDRDDCAGRRIGLEQIALINPKVASSNAIGSAPADSHAAVFHAPAPPCTFQISITNCRPS